ncbi:MAG: acyl-CoA dehydrogenase family protein [Promethearchaeota archaeon]
MFRGVDVLSEKAKEKLTTANFYKIFNSFVVPLITHEEREFMLQLQDFCVNVLEPKIDLTRDVYHLFPVLGREGYMQRLNPIDGLEPHGMRYELILAMCLSILDPELDLARVVSGVLATNPLSHHGKTDAQMRALGELVRGEKVGAITITERTRGSDAVNMLTTATPASDGSGEVVLNGEKIFTTNGPKADYFVAYGVRDSTNPRGTMYQLLVERGMEGLETNRMGIHSIPRVHVGQTIYDQVRVPADRVLGAEGAGYRNLFGGLVAERNTIIGSSLGISWLSAITALVYTSVREQFGRPVLDHQGVGFPLAQLLIELMAATNFGFRAATEYEKIERYPEKLDDMVKYNSSFSAGTKFLASNLAHRLSYEAQQMCGGVGYTDNLRIDRAIEVSKVQEVIGGSRNVQLILVNRAMRAILRMLD